MKQKLKNSGLKNVLNLALLNLLPDMLKKELEILKVKFSWAQRNFQFSAINRPAKRFSQNGKKLKDFVFNLLARL